MTLCMKCRILFSGENKENISKCCLLKCIPNMPHVYTRKVFNVCNDELLLHSNSEDLDQPVHHLDLLCIVPIFYSIH